MKTISLLILLAFLAAAADNTVIVKKPDNSNWPKWKQPAIPKGGFKENYPVK